MKPMKRGGARGGGRGGAGRPVGERSGGAPEKRLQEVGYSQVAIYVHGNDVC